MKIDAQRMPTALPQLLLLLLLAGAAALASCSDEAPPVPEHPARQDAGGGPPDGGAATDVGGSERPELGPADSGAADGGKAGDAGSTADAGPQAYGAVAGDIVLVGAPPGEVLGFVVVELYRTEGELRLQARASGAGISGSYRFERVPAGDGYSLSASRPGYDSATIHDISVRAGQTNEEIPILRLQARPGSVSGRVRLDGRQDHSGIVVGIYGTGLDGQTDGQGSYRIEAIPPGEHTLRASYTGFAPQQLAFRLGPEERRELPDLRLVRQKGSIVGTARLADRAHHAGIRVEVIGTGYFALTEDDGTYTLEEIPESEGGYSLEARFPGFLPARVADVRVQAGQEFNPRPLELQPAPATVRGLVRRVDRGPGEHGGVLVQLRTANCGAVSQDDGSFVIASEICVRPGVHLLEAIADGYLSAASEAFETEPGGEIALRPILLLPDHDGDGHTGSEWGGLDCDDSSRSCFDVCLDQDRDRLPDCRDPCVDADRDGYGVGPACRDVDCLDQAGACTTVCRDDDRDGTLDCLDDCLDQDGDGVCAQMDCDDLSRRCADDCLRDLDGDGRDCDDPCVDTDGDGYGLGPDCRGPDCLDDPLRRGEQCTTLCVDEDGDGWADCADTCLDFDHDGFGVGEGCRGADCFDDPVRGATCQLVCADLDADALPDCADGCIDRDRDGFGDEALRHPQVPATCQPDCNDSSRICGLANCVTNSDRDPVPDCADPCVDNDGDGFGNRLAQHAEPGSCPATDCDDNNGNIKPGANEICDPFGTDEDCDGRSNEGCACVNGTNRPCDGGSDVGQCRRGQQTCINGAWGLCIGRVEPRPEDCKDRVDNDCDGATDECDPGTCCRGDIDTCAPGLRREENWVELFEGYNYILGRFSAGEGRLRNYGDFRNYSYDNGHNLNDSVSSVKARLSSCVSVRLDEESGGFGDPGQYIVISGNDGANIIEIPRLDNVSVGGCITNTCLGGCNDELSSLYWTVLDNGRCFCQ